MMTLSMPAFANRLQRQTSGHDSFKNILTGLRRQFACQAYNVQRQAERVISSADESRDRASSKEKADMPRLSGSAIRRESFHTQW